MKADFNTIRVLVIRPYWEAFKFGVRFALGMSWYTIRLTLTFILFALFLFVCPKELLGQTGIMNGPFAKRALARKKAQS